MTELNPPLFLQNHNAHTAQGDRQLIASLVPQNNCLDAGSLLVTESDTPGMSVKVAAGRCVIHGTEDPWQGAYHCVNDDAKTLVIAAADSTNGRKDIVVARVYDAEYSGADNKFALEVITGTPALTPVAPAVPDNAVKLAEVTVDALATSITNAKIADTRPVVAIGGDTDALPKGYVTHTVVNTDSGSVSGNGNIAGLSAAFTAAADRRYKVSVQAFVRQSAGAGTTYLRLNGGGLSNHRITGARMYGGDTNNDRDIMHGFAIITPSAGPVSMQVGYESSGGTIQILGSLLPSTITVEDIGPA